MRDVRLALRYLIKSPGYTAAAIVTLAIAIGANSAIFSAVYGVLIRPLPIREPSQLTMVWDADPGRSLPVIELSYRQFERWAAAPGVFENAAAIGASTWPILLEDRGESTRLSLSGVSSSFFETLGAQPLLGRALERGDDAPGARKVAILSHGVWTRLFGADRGVIGRTVTLDGPTTIVGVMPEGFAFPRGTDVWMPVVPILADSGTSWNTDALDKVGVLVVIGRVRDGVSHASIPGALDAVMPPGTPGRYGTETRVTPFSKHFYGPVQEALFALLAAVVLLLLMACANVSALMLARVSSRRGEDAVRLALGATRAALARHWAIETALLFAAGGALGMAAGPALTALLVSLAPPDVPRLAEVSFDARVALGTFAATLVAAVLCATPTIRFAASTGFAEVLNTARSTRSKRAFRTRSVLVALQVAFTLALMITATLVVRSFVNLRRIDLGFAPDRVVTMGLEPRGAANGHVNTWVRDLIERVRALPDVEAAGAVYLRPLALGPIGQETWVVLEGQTNDEETRRRSPTLNYEVATPGYFTAMRVPLLRGRLFTDKDRPGQERVAIVGASAARRMWPGQDPVGKRVLLPTFVRGDKVPVWRTVVGVVSDVRYRGLDDVRLDVYDAAMQAATPATDLVVRSSGDPLRLIAAIEAEARRLDPRVVVDRVTTMGAIIDKETAPWRFSVWVLTLFGAIAFALAGVGLFGLVALDVGERAREFAIRLALGAQRGDVIRSALAAAAVRVTAGLAGGALAALAIGRAIRSMLFGVTPLDVPSFAIAVALVVLVVSAASFVPARRAASIDPLKLLRGDAQV